MTRFTRLSFPRALGALGFLGLVTITAPAGATFSIIAADTDTGVVGAAVASCVGTEVNLSDVVALEANVGGVVAQALFSAAGRDQAFSEIQMGATPEEALSTVLSTDFDTNFESRQYAAVTVDGSVAAFTGKEADEHADHLPQTVDRIVYSVQGNILTDSAVLESLVLGFEATQGGIGERLVGALEQVVIRGGGDSRCDPRSADTAYLEVRIPGETAVVHEVLSMTEEEDATALLVDAAKGELPEEPDVIETESYTSFCGCEMPGKRSRPWGNAPWGSALTLVVAIAVVRRRLSVQ